jgi:hypothetical protein
VILKSCKLPFSAIGSAFRQPVNVMSQGQI